MGKDTTLERYGPKGTPVGRVRGLGAGHHGTHDWLAMRYTSVGSLLLCAFLLVSFVLLPDLSYTTVRDWIADPIPATAIALLVITVFWHARLGLQVLIEDYVHVPGNRFAALLVVNLAAFAGAAFGLLCLIRIGLGSA